MSTTTIEFDWLVGGVATDVTSAVLCDPTSAYGVKRTDTNAVVIAANTALNHDGTGQYSYQFVDPAEGLTYAYYLKIVYAGDTYFLPRTISGAGGVALPTYLGVADADALAANVPASLLSFYNAANSSDKAIALAQASSDVDQAMVYQGRRYDLSTAQVLEFPRMAYESAARVRNVGVMALPAIPPGYGDVVWDWDSTNLVPVIPQNVLLATLYQANFILGGVGEERLNEQHAGVTSTSGGGLSEAYDPKGHGSRTGLCRRAYQLMRRYEIVQGRMM